ncbi:MAG TPA: hypothetical protein PKH77_21680 [Anaerolineae bacterium]|nr:hypothetical protein [Anaerolineae bacterium]
MPIVNDKYRGKTTYHLVYNELITAARYQGVTTYQAIAQLMGLPSQGNHMGAEIGQILSEISEDELLQHRPMLSAVVVSVSGKPGQGFYVLAQNLGKFNAGDDELKFWETEKAAVYKAWQREFK